MNWEACCYKKTVKKVKADNDMIEALKKASDHKIQSEDKLIMNEITATSKLSLAYDALREVLEALALQRGYKIYNHECFTAFLKEIIKESEKGDEFDEIRKIRNDVNYYGKEISPEEARVYIQRIKNLRKQINSLFERTGYKS